MATKWVNKCRFLEFVKKAGNPGIVTIYTGDIQCCRQGSDTSFMDMDVHPNAVALLNNYVPLSTVFTFDTRNKKIHIQSPYTVDIALKDYERVDNISKITGAVPASVSVGAVPQGEYSKNQLVEELREVKSEYDKEPLQLACIETRTMLKSLHNWINKQENVTCMYVLSFIDNYRAKRVLGYAYPTILVPSMTDKVMVANGFHPVLPFSESFKSDTYMLIDVGFQTFPNGMCCDITEMIPIGNPPDYMKKFVKMVRDLCDNAFEMARKYRNFSTLSKYIRRRTREMVHNYLKEEGVTCNENDLPSDFMGHALGHPVGITVHDPRSGNEMKEGSTWALEPAVYFTESRPIAEFLEMKGINFLGARIERVGVM